MEIKKISVSDLFAWLLASLALVRKHPGTFLLGSVVSVLAIVLIVIIAGVVLGLGSIGAASSGAQIDWQKISMLYAGAILVFLLIAPPFMAGWFVFTGNLAEGRSASVQNLFSGYSDSALWKKLIVFSLISAVLYVAIHAVYIGLCMAFGIGSDEISQFVSAQISNDPNALMNLSAGFWAAYVGIILLGTLVQMVFALGFAQAALTQSNAIDSIKAGIAGALKNFGSLLVFLLAMLLVTIAVVLVLGILAGLVIALLSILNKSIALALGVVLYVFVLLYIYPLMFSFMYYCWQGILGEKPTATTHNDSAVLL